MQKITGEVQLSSKTVKQLRINSINGAQERL